MFGGSLPCGGVPWGQAGELSPARSTLQPGHSALQLVDLLHCPSGVCSAYTLAVLLPCPRATNKQGVGPGKQKSLCLASFFLFFLAFFFFFLVLFVLGLAPALQRGQVAGWSSLSWPNPSRESDSCWTGARACAEGISDQSWQQPKRLVQTGCEA